MTLFVTLIRHCPVPEIIVHQRHRASLPAESQFRLGMRAFVRLIILRTGENRCRSHIFGGILGIVKSHHPTTSVTPYLLVSFVGVFMEILSGTPRRIEVAIAM